MDALFWNGMRKIMVIQHVAHEPLGTLNPMLKDAGFRIRYVNFARDPDLSPSLEGYRGLIVLGGPMGVYEIEHYKHLQTEMKLIEEALKRDLPVLGICLGSQLLAHVLGARVFKAPAPEIGWLDVHLKEEGRKDSLFQHYNPAEKIFQLHQDTFDVPKEAVHLAYSPQIEGQAYRYGSKVYGLQFHLEVDKPMIHRWLKIQENKEMIAGSRGLYSSEQIVADTDRLMERNLKLSRQTFAKFIEIFQLPERPVLLGTDHGKPY